MLAAAHWDQTVRLWDINTGNRRPLSTFTGHRGEIHAVTFLTGRQHACQWKY